MHLITPRSPLPKVPLKLQPSPSRRAMRIWPPNNAETPPSPMWRWRPNSNPLLAKHRQHVQKKGVASPSPSQLYTPTSPNWHSPSGSTHSLYRMAIQQRRNKLHPTPILHPYLHRDKSRPNLPVDHLLNTLLKSLTKAPMELPPSPATTSAPTLPPTQPQPVRTPHNVPHRLRSSWDAGHQLRRRAPR